MKIYLDVAPILDIHWTGLAVVTKNIARELLRSAPKDTHFFAGDTIISSELVSRALESPGGYLQVFANKDRAVTGSLWTQLEEEKAETVGIFPNIKWVHRAFDRELLIVHDLSFMLCPEMHAHETVRRHNIAIQRDLASSDFVCCVSEATRQDLITYTGYNEDRVFVSHLGADDVRPVPIDPYDFSNLKKKYILVLGTVEPRKNLMLLSQFLARYPGVSEEYSFAIVGRAGWGKQFDKIFEDAFASGVGHDKIIATGFLSNHLKRDLIRNAYFVIFPSIFEGFGLPVVEAMGSACPALVSASSSMTELGVPKEWQFDPLSVNDFASRFFYACSLSNTERGAIGKALQEKTLKSFKWEYFVNRIMERLRA